MQQRIGFGWAALRRRHGGLFEDVCGMKRGRGPLSSISATLIRGHRKSVGSDGNASGAANDLNLSCIMV